ncbi:unnamed protein product [Clavelina lepadiformis]|uniref:Uncharacterized protein n=1 Tax=Clavelina lepadiformis TaxID=159417 RepID=A0ABP0H0H9_CLALP
MLSDNFNHWDDTFSCHETELALPTCLSKSLILIGSCNLARSATSSMVIIEDVLLQASLVLKQNRALICMHLANVLMGTNVLFITTKKKRIFLSTRIVFVKN